MRRQDISDLVFDVHVIDLDKDRRLLVARTYPHNYLVRFRPEDYDETGMMMHGTTVYRLKTEEKEGVRR